MLSPRIAVYPAVSHSASSNHRDKIVTRRVLLSRRDALDAVHRSLASARIAERVATLLPNAGAVAIYAPKGTEVDTLAIDERVRELGGDVLYPRVADDTTVLEFHRATPEQLLPGRFSLREPAPSDLTLVNIIDIDAFVIPGLAFDRHGWRIGWGRGHYDATLATARPSALRIGLGFECQVIDQIVHEPHDAKLDYVVTELATYRAA